MRARCDIRRKKLKALMELLVKDIESNSKELHCYAYPKTIRSILIGSPNSQIACHFSEKPYFGILKKKPTLSKIQKLFDTLVEEGNLSFEMHNGKKRYVSNEKMEKNRKNSLSDEEISEIDDLLNLL